MVGSAFLRKRKAESGEKSLATTDQKSGDTSAAANDSESAAGAAAATAAAGDDRDLPPTFIDPTAASTERVETIHRPPQSTPVAREEHIDSDAEAADDPAAALKAKLKRRKKENPNIQSVCFAE